MRPSNIPPSAESRTVGGIAKRGLLEALHRGEREV